MTAKDYKIISSRNFSYERIAGNSLSCVPWTMLTISSNFVAKADTNDVVVWIAMQEETYPSDNQTTVQERVTMRPVMYHDQYVLEVKTGQSASVSNIHNLYAIYTDPVTGKQYLDLATAWTNIEVVDIITSSVVIVQIKHRVDPDAWSPAFDNVDYIQFDLTPSVTTPAEWQLARNEDEWTLSLWLPWWQATLNIGQEIHIPKRVKNNTVTNFTNGQLVYISWGDGINLYVDLASNDNKTKAHGTIAMLTEDIDAWAKGYATTFWLVRGTATQPIDTSSFTIGQDIFLGTNWSFIGTSPTSPAHRILIGKVDRVHETEGAILVNIQEWIDLEDVDDVLIDTLWDDELLQYNASTWVRENRTLAEANITRLDYNGNNDSAGRLRWWTIIANLTPWTVDIAEWGWQVKIESWGIGCCDAIPSALNQWQASLTQYVSRTAQTAFPLAWVWYNLIYRDASAWWLSVSLQENFYSEFDFVTDFIIGRVYYDWTNVTVRLCGMNRWNFDRRVQMFGEERFPIERARGLMISETGTRNFAITAWVIRAELVNRFETTAIDTSWSDTFTYRYRDWLGWWTKVTSQSQINNTNYDDGDGTLWVLTANRYGVHWVYVVHDNSVHVVYGQGDYLLSQAEAVSPPATLPWLVWAYATLVGKIIIQKSASSFTETLSPFTTTFQATVASNHNDLAWLQWGTTWEYYHLTSTEYTWLVTDSNTKTLTNKTINADNNTISDLELDNFKSSVVVITSEWIASNDNDTTFPTSWAVKAYVDSVLSSIWAVTSVNGQTWAVVLDADDIDDTSTTNKFVTTTQISNRDTAYWRWDHAGAWYATITWTETLTNKTLTAPKIANGWYIADENGNEIMVFETVSSAVNNIRIKNAWAWWHPIIEAEWSDTNIGVYVQPKWSWGFNVLWTSTYQWTINMYEDTDNGTSFVRFRAPASIATTFNITLPNTAWASGQAMISNGSWDLSWTDIVTPTWTETLTNKTLTAPKFADLWFIADANGNQLLIFNSIGSAVNEFTIANATTGNAPYIATTWWDANINLDIYKKWTGTVNFRGNSSAPWKISLYEQTGNWTNKITITAPTAITSDITLTLPTPSADDTFVTTTTTDTLTNKRITPRIGTTTSSATPTPNGDAHDQYTVTALAVDATLWAPTWTPTDWQKLIIRIKDNGTSRTLWYNGIYRAVWVTLPTATTISKTLYLWCVYNTADSKWDVIALAQEA